MDPAMIALEFVKALAEATPKLFELFSHLGSRDAFLAACDGALETARKKADADITAKHHPHE